MNEKPLQQATIGDAPPYGICDECMAAFEMKRLTTADGGKVIGGYCIHNRAVAVIRQLPDGTFSCWRIWTPQEARDLEEHMSRAAESIAGIQAARAEHRLKLN